MHTAPAVVPAPPVAAAPVPADTLRSDSGEKMAPAEIPPIQADSLEAAVHSAMAQAATALGLSDSALFAPVTMDSAAGEVASAGDEATWDIDVRSYATHDRVTRYVELFSGKARDRIQARLQRGKRYEPMIRAKFRAAGIPEDMYYLGLVESGYDPHAYSRAAAVGMWQFMTSTARGVGLRVDGWVDERRDPVRATDAAARFLNDLYAQFGSYYLAAAAYNGGPGRVSRGLARFQDELDEAAGDDKFFALAEQSYLRSETRNYVPQLIAAALVGKTPARFGMTVSDSVPLFAYDSVRTGELVGLGTVAQASQATIDEIRDLNPMFLRGSTPPRYQGWVRVPVGRAALFDSTWSALPDSERTGFVHVRSQKGQSLATIAKARGLDAHRLSWYNPGVSSSRRLPVGTDLLVPTAAVLSVARDVPDPAIERYGSGGGSGRVVHVVRRGESLGSIAMRYRTSVATLKRVNGLRRSVVYPGQSIIVRSAPRGRSARVASRSKGKAVARGGTAGSRTKARARTKAGARKKAAAKKTPARAKAR